MSLLQAMMDPGMATVTWRQKQKYLPETPSSNHAWFNLTGDITDFRTHYNVEKHMINGVQALRSNQYPDDSYLASYQLHPYVNAPLTKHSAMLPNLMSVNPLAGSNYLGSDMVTKSNNPLAFAMVDDPNFEDILNSDSLPPNNPLSAHYALAIYARKHGDTFQNPETQRIVDENNQYLAPHITNIRTYEIDGTAVNYTEYQNEAINRASQAIDSRFRRLPRGRNVPINDTPYANTIIHREPPINADGTPNPRAGQPLANQNAGQPTFNRYTPNGPIPLHEILRVPYNQELILNPRHILRYGRADMFEAVFNRLANHMHIRNDAAHQELMNRPYSRSFLGQTAGGREFLGTDFDQYRLLQNTPPDEPEEDSVRRYTPTPPRTPRDSSRTFTRPPYSFLLSVIEYATKERENT